MRDAKAGDIPHEIQRDVVAAAVEVAADMARQTSDGDVKKAARAVAEAGVLAWRIVSPVDTAAGLSETATGAVQVRPGGSAAVVSDLLSDSLNGSCSGHGALKNFTASEIESGRRDLEAHVLWRVDVVRSRRSASRGQAARNSGSTQVDRDLPSRGA